MWLWFEYKFLLSQVEITVGSNWSLLVHCDKSLKIDLNFYFQLSLRPLRIQSNQMKQLFLSRSLGMKLSIANSKIDAPRDCFYLPSHLQHEILVYIGDVYNTPVFNVALSLCRILILYCSNLVSMQLLNSNFQEYFPMNLSKAPLCCLHLYRFCPLIHFVN